MVAVSFPTRKRKILWSAPIWLAGMKAEQGAMVQRADKGALLPGADGKARLPGLV